MKMTAVEVMGSLTQNEYDRLLSNLAGAIHTHRRLISIISAERVNAVTVRYTVKRKGTYYPYVIEEVSRPYGNIYFNLGLKI